MYTAYITPLTNVRKHPNADRLQLATVLGNQVVIGLEHADGDVGIFFPIDGQLSKEYAEANDLIARKDPVTGQRAGGFLDEKRRIKAQKFRGVRSEGLWMPLSSLDYIGDPETQTLTSGPITSFGYHPLCNRYETAATQAKAQLNQRKARPESPFFPKHVETDQFMVEVAHIPVGSTLYISEKLHGTSHREGYTWMERKLNRAQRIINRISMFILGHDVISTTSLEYVIGTRNTVLGDNKPDYYNSADFRHNVAHQIHLNPGEILYGEIV